MNSIPLVTVLMPVYNGEKYLREAIESILSQTFKDFELLIINDGSSDSSEEIILSYKDSRIEYVKNEQNIRLIATLNKGLELAKGKYIARMDADDISIVSRLDKQVRFLEENPTIGLLGSAFEVIGIGSKKSYPIVDHEIRFSLLFLNTFLHSSVIFRKELCVTNNLFFDNKYIHAEDYKLWTELMFKTNVYNLDEALVKYRVHDNQISQIHSKEQIEITQKIQKEYLETAGFELTTQEFEMIQNSRNLNTFGDKTYDYLIVFDKLYDQNQIIAFFDERVIFDFLAHRYKTAIFDLDVIDSYIADQLSKSLIFNKINWTIRQRISFKMKKIKGMYQKN